MALEPLLTQARHTHRIIRIGYAGTKAKSQKEVTFFTHRRATVSKVGRLAVCVASTSAVTTTHVAFTIPTAQRTFPLATICFDIDYESHYNNKSKENLNIHGGQCST